MSEKPKLVLHFDVNNTILAADPVCGVDLSAALNTYLAGVCWGSEKDGTWEWAESTLKGAFTTSRPEGAEMSYYKHLEAKMSEGPREEFKAAVGHFSESAEGAVARPLFERMLAGLTTKEIREPPFAFKQGDEWYYYLLPSFWRLLAWLQEEGRDFAIVIRTYGTDGPEVSKAIAAFAEGKHPDFPTACPRAKPAMPAFGSFKRGSSESGTGSVALELQMGPTKSSGENEATAELTSTLNGEGHIFAHLSRLQGTLCIRDDFEFWQRGGFTAASGKPLWFVEDVDARRVQHILFDDNIRTWCKESIADSRLLAPGPKGTWISSGSCPPLAAEEAGCLVPAELHRSTVELDYFVDAVRECEARWGRAAL